MECCAHRRVSQANRRETAALRPEISRAESSPSGGNGAERNFFRRGGAGRRAYSRTAAWTGGATGTVGAVMGVML